MIPCFHLLQKPLLASSSSSHQQSSHFSVIAPIFLFFYHFLFVPHQDSSLLNTSSDPAMEETTSTGTLTPSSSIDSLPILPYEIVVDVLSRLPVKSLMRFQCVCKSFKSLITDPSFAKKHLHASATRHQRFLLNFSSPTLTESGNGVRHQILPSLLRLHPHAARVSFGLLHSNTWQLQWNLLYGNP